MTDTPKRHIKRRVFIHHFTDAATINNSFTTQIFAKSVVTVFEITDFGRKQMDVYFTLMNISTLAIVSCKHETNGVLQREKICRMCHNQISRVKQHLRYQYFHLTLPKIRKDIAFHFNTLCEFVPKSCIPRVIVCAESLES
jgi:hypothetical protein